MTKLGSKRDDKILKDNEETGKRLMEEIVKIINRRKGPPKSRRS